MQRLPSLPAAIIHGVWSSAATCCFIEYESITRAKLGDITNLVQDQYEEKKVLTDACWEKKEARCDDDAQITELRDVALRIYDDMERDKSIVVCDDERRESQESKLFLVLQLHFLVLIWYILQVYRRSLRNSEQKNFNNVKFRQTDLRASNFFKFKPRWVHYIIVSSFYIHL